MMGVPSTVVGILAYAVLLWPIGGFSALAGAEAPGTIMISMIPVISVVTRTTEQMVLAAGALGLIGLVLTLEPGVRWVAGGAAKAAR